MSTKINDIDFVEQILALKEKYEKIIKAQNFLDDNRQQFRRAISAIDSDTDIYFAISESIKEAKNSLLISCYTIAEQMLKETKYQLLNFDPYNESRLQSFLSYKLKPEKFSPNPKSDEINKFFKRYDSSKLFLKDLKLYDDMIKCRHRYAHRGVFQFDIDNIPKLIDILLYLEFEYRMFLRKDSWCMFSEKVNTIVSEKVKQLIKQEKFAQIESEIRGLIPEIILNLSDSNNIVSDLKDILNELKNEREFIKFAEGLKQFRDGVEAKISL